MCGRVCVRAAACIVCVCVRLRVSAWPAAVAKIDEACFHNGNLFFFSLVHAGQIFVDFSRIMFMCLVFVRRLGLSFVFLASALSYF